MMPRLSTIDLGKRPQEPGDPRAVEQRPDGYVSPALGHAERLALQALCGDGGLPPVDRQERAVDATRFVLAAAEADALAVYVAAAYAQDGRVGVLTGFIDCPG
ncbi:hypothetical protein ABT150_17625 [Streptomyces mirabilis]|uniref:hypothetical protein n=1 Tax=Streptomyces mirabilis TaxID=68239 RepID=UPI00332FFB59